MMDTVDDYLRGQIDKMLVTVELYVKAERYIEAMKLLDVTGVLINTLKQRNLTTGEDQ